MSREYCSFFFKHLLINTICLNHNAMCFVHTQQRAVPFNVLLINLAFSDFVITSFGATVSAYASWLEGWHYGHEFCIAYGMIMSTAGKFNYAAHYTHFVWISKPLLSDNPIFARE